MTRHWTEAPPPVATPRSRAERDASRGKQSPRPRACPPSVRPYEAYRPPDEGGADLNLRDSSLFLDGRGPVWDTLRQFARRLEEAKIPYAVLGAMALNAHGHARVTTDIDVVVTEDARRRIHGLLGLLDGWGFLPPFEGSRNLRDTTNGVKIDLLQAGGYPGDDTVKPVTFPDPAGGVFVRDGVRYVTREQLVELKLASGMTNPARLKDLGDVISLIGSTRLPREFGERLHPWVRAKWYELWDAWDQDPRKDMF
jgi:hypothetical protein